MEEPLGNPHRQRLKNYCLKTEAVDSLHAYADEYGMCSGQLCAGSLMSSRQMGLPHRAPSLVLAHAKTFLDQFYRETKEVDSVEDSRWQEVALSVAKRGTYDLTYEELVFGAKLAWRNAPRCIGRIQWNRIDVFDARHVTTAKEMCEAIFRHIQYATNDGNIRSTLTVFPQRLPGRRDFRVWNTQLISYAGYRNDDGTITGDPGSVEITQVFQDLGWRGRGSRFDVLPLVVSTPFEKPQWFEIPEELVLRVTLEHPKYDWFKELGLQWFALPAVSGMLLDCGGIEFTAAPFSGWYMSTEIASRDLCDAQRYNVVRDVAEGMRLDTRNPTTLWKDQAALEVNIAVLHSFKKAKVTLVDHHTAAESFMQFFNNEHRNRGGCPADWVWIVPPISSSLTPVFHQEMALYYLKPAYEYQEVAWVAFNKQNRMSNENKNDRAKRSPFRKALMRVRATILFATETGKSEIFAHELGDVFRTNFNVQVQNLKDYDNRKLSTEKLVLFVTSTTGNGDAPLAAQHFVKHVFGVAYKGSKLSVTENYNSWKSNTGTNNNYLLSRKQPEEDTWLSRLWRRKMGLFSERSKLSVSGQSAHFAVFALGSSDYKYFCVFGKYLDHLMGLAGHNRLCEVTCGDDLEDQRATFKRWSLGVFKAASKVLCPGSVHLQAENELILQEDKVKLSPASGAIPLIQGLRRAHGLEVVQYTVEEVETLYEKAERWVVRIALKSPRGQHLKYQPGGCVGVFPANPPEMVDTVLKHLKNCSSCKNPVEVLERKSASNVGDTAWKPHLQLPVASVEHLLTRYLDLSSPPSQSLLALFASCASSSQQAAKITQLATDKAEYQKWKSSSCPNLPQTLLEFPSVAVDAGLLLSRLPLIRPRFYSVSSDQDTHGDSLHLTVGSVVYQDSNGSIRRGLSSNYLSGLKAGDAVELFHKSSQTLRLPEDPTKPILLVAIGVGIAPFRSFWHHLNHLNEALGQKRQVTLYFGCRTHDEDLYLEEKIAMVRSGVLSRTHLALSREPYLPKTHVHDLLVKHDREVYKHLAKDFGFVYVCGNERLSESVYSALQIIVQQCGNLSKKKTEDFLGRLKEEKRYIEEYSFLV